MLRVRKPSSRVPRLDGDARSRPIMLATFDVPFDPRAVTLAVDAAVEAGQPLLVANVVELPPLPLSIVMGYDQLEYTPQMDTSMRAPAELAASLGVTVERIRVRTLRPVEALLQVVKERRPGLLVFGPDRAIMSRRRYLKAARAVRADATCLVWLSD